MERRTGLDAGAHRHLTAADMEVVTLFCNCRVILGCNFGKENHLDEMKIF